MNAFASVDLVLSQYFDALYYCDVDRLKAVFHPRAVYATADEASTLVRTMPEYIAVVAERQSPASRREARRDHVDAIEFAGANTARARVRCSIGRRDFVDFLTLIRTDAGWRIIAKVFQIVEQSELN